MLHYNCILLTLLYIYIYIYIYILVYSNNSINDNAYTPNLPTNTGFLRV